MLIGAGVLHAQTPIQILNPNNIPNVYATCFNTSGNYPVSYYDTVQHQKVALSGALSRA